jgi:hypothetical protein
MQTTLLRMLIKARWENVSLNALVGTAGQGWPTTTSAFPRSEPRPACMFLVYRPKLLTYGQMAISQYVSKFEVDLKDALAF